MNVLVFDTSTNNFSLSIIKDKKIVLNLSKNINNAKIISYYQKVKPIFKRKEAFLQNHKFYICLGMVAAQPIAFLFCSHNTCVWVSFSPAPERPQTA